MCSQVPSAREYLYVSWSRTQRKSFSHPPPSSSILIFSRNAFHIPVIYYITILIFRSYEFTSVFFLDFIDNFMKIYKTKFIRILARNHFKPDNSLIRFIDFSNLTREEGNLLYYPYLQVISWGEEIHFSLMIYNVIILQTTQQHKYKLNSRKRTFIFKNRSIWVCYDFLNMKSINASHSLV